MKAIFLTISILITASLQSGHNNIVFDLADLTIDFPVESQTIRLEAFKISTNEVIIEQKQTHKYGQLNWVSIGHPELVYTNNSIFDLTPEGFDISIELLTDFYRGKFVEKVQQKYGISILPEQIVTLRPAKLECHLTLFDDDNNKFIIIGKSHQSTSFPAKVTFNAPLMSKERFEFDKILEHQTNIDIDCVVHSEGKSTKQNALTITLKQMNDLKLVDDIFGESSEVFVTRTQTNALSSKLYQSLNIIETYQIPESQFKIGFVEDLIRQTALSIDEFVPFEEAVGSLSRLNYDEDLEPDVLTAEFGKLFTIEQVNEKERIVTNVDAFKNSREKTEGSIEASLGIVIKGFQLNPSIDLDSNFLDDSKNDVKTVTDELKELNRKNQSDIEWKRVGNKIVPKSLKVTKLSKSMFERDLKFTRIRREYYDAPFKREFTLKTSQISSSLTVARYETFLTEVKKITEELNQDMEDVVKYFNGSTFDGEPSFAYDKGTWSFGGSIFASSKDSYVKTVTAKYPKFMQPPIVFYTVEKINSKKGSILYTIENERIENDKITCDVRIQNHKNLKGLSISWIAIGFVL